MAADVRQMIVFRTEPDHTPLRSWNDRAVPPGGFPEHPLPVDREVQAGTGGVRALDVEITGRLPV
ncbi:hypothetical protein [Actinomadura craniellae]|uniref:hypothetical protein n=1 Tax=Actinomadura craniellae TaxID=2231787 RepID=UPI0011BF8733|nr:hypothetical protein [Actinomadura craniellae]